MMQQAAAKFCHPAKTESFLLPSRERERGREREREIIERERERERERRDDIKEEK